ncbi:MAG: divalent-cation tolerance protein CutA [Deltaproteobacteria bacterium]|nr:MAG: divalent-cation tolerance protein CutA [Deltaproteobacteria bacterium]
MDIRVVYITCANIEEAKKIGREIVEKRFAACANIIDKIESFYWWEGKLQEDKEALIIAKTRSSLVNELIKKVKDIHSYECPCIVTLPVLEGNTDFLEWIIEETKD